MRKEALNTPAAVKESLRLAERVRSDPMHLGNILKDFDEDISIIRGAAMRYYGQLHSIDVFLPEHKAGNPFTDETTESLIRGFHDRHDEIYGRSDTEMPVTIEEVKLHAVGKRAPFEINEKPSHPEDASAPLKRKRQVYFKDDGGFTETPCYDGDLLQPGNVVTGPAFIEETKTTVVISRGYRINVDAYGNYMMRRC